MMPRRNFLHACASLLALAPVSGPGTARATLLPKLDEARVRGERFLRGLLDAALNLLPEYRGANVYWLYHDNYLAAHVLQPREPELARKIQAAIAGYGVTKSGKIEILFDEATHPLPFRHYRLREVKRLGKKIIKTEVVEDKVFHGWTAYADLLFLAAVALAKTDAPQARRHFHAGLRLWDGRGFRDQVNHATGDKYATYKLALALVAAHKLGEQPNIHIALRQRLLALQSREGGWITDYDAQTKPVGLANVETTALALLALNTWRA